MEEFKYLEDKISLINENEEIGYVKYNIHDDFFVLLSTVINEKYRGKGYAKKLMEETESFIKKNNYRLIIKCSYAFKYFSKSNAEDKIHKN